MTLLEVGYLIHPEVFELQEVERLVFVCFVGGVRCLIWGLSFNRWCSRFLQVAEAQEECQCIEHSEEALIDIPEKRTTVCKSNTSGNSAA